MWTLTRSYQAECRQYAAHRFSHFLLNAFVRRVTRRRHMRIVRFWRSTCDVQFLAESGSPMAGTFSACVTLGGLYRRRCQAFSKRLRRPTAKRGAYGSWFAAFRAKPF